jgi:hypothetical protein
VRKFDRAANRPVSKADRVCAPHRPSAVRTDDFARRGQTGQKGELVWINPRKQRVLSEVWSRFYRGVT